MRRLAIVLGFLAAVGAAPVLAQEQPSDRRAEAVQRQYDRCAPHSISAGACPSMRVVTDRFNRSERERQTRALYASIDALLTTGDCEGARARAADEGRHELAARIRRACKAAS